MTKNVGILTSGGDTPGLNAAIRGLGKAGSSCFGMNFIGFKDGFRGLMENRSIPLENKMLSGILTLGGTILGTSREKPYRMNVGGKEMDMTEVIVENYHRNNLDVLVCLGGNGTQKNAYHLQKAGLNVITMPKTIDNDVVQTDMSFGFDTALGIATEAIDRLHSTASSHHRIIVVEIMGHKAGWLALGAGIAGGADVILIPEIPYSIEKVADSILERRKQGKSFSIVAVAEGAKSVEFSKVFQDLQSKIDLAADKESKKKFKLERAELESLHTTNTLRLANRLHDLTKIDSRVTILGHLQRGGTPSAYDRILASKLGTACAEYIHNRKFGVMVAIQNNEIVAVPLEKVVKKTKNVPEDHMWIRSARMVGTCLGD
jgi:phosphofructokinase-like protein